MVDVRKLDYPDTVTLLPGATQHLADLALDPVTATPVIRHIVGDLTGRVLVAGAHDLTWLAEIATGCDLTVVVRGIPDAAAIATALPDARVLCGSLQHVSDTNFDAVVALTDLARVLSLEEEPRTWRELYDDLAARVADRGRFVCAVDNDRGLHRLTGAANPRSRDWDQDWSVMATWDRSRPRSTEQVANLSDGTVWACYPQFSNVTVADCGVLDNGLTAARDAAVFAAASRPLAGPDPLWHVESAAAADKTRDVCAGWILDTAAAAEPQVVRAAPDRTVHLVPAVSADARTILAVIGERLAAHDLPLARALLQEWTHWLTDDVCCDLALTTISDDGTIESIAAIGEGPREPWGALADVIAIARSHGWRIPWPSPMSDAALVQFLGAMANLPHRSQDQLETLLSRTPDVDTSSYAHLGKQDLVAVLEREKAQVHTLRSRQNWTELQFVTTKAQRKAKNKLNKVLRRAKRLLTMIVGH